MRNFINARGESGWAVRVAQGPALALLAFAGCAVDAGATELGVDALEGEGVLLPVEGGPTDGRDGISVGEELVVEAENIDFDEDGWELDGDEPGDGSEARPEECTDVRQRRWFRRFKRFGEPKAELLDEVEVTDMNGDGRDEYPQEVSGFNPLLSRRVCYARPGEADPFQVTTANTRTSTGTIVASSADMTTTGVSVAAQGGWSASVGFPIGSGGPGVPPPQVQVGWSHSTTETETTSTSTTTTSSVSDSYTVSTTVTAGTEVRVPDASAPMCRDEAVGFVTVRRRFRQTWRMTQIEQFWKRVATCSYCAHGNIPHICARPEIREVLEGQELHTWDVTVDIETEEQLLVVRLGKPQPYSPSGARSRR